jgi:hypothetical protein
MTQPELTTTEYTALGYRLSSFPTEVALIVSVETPWLDLAKKTHTSIVVARVVILTATQYAVNLGFLRHSLAFFKDDDLVAQGVALLQAHLVALPAGGDPPAQSNPDAN